MVKVFNIPTDYHLAKFVIQEFWEGQKAPYRVDEGSLVGKQVFAILVDQRTHKDKVFNYESQISIMLSDTLAKRSPDLIKLSRINLFLEELFKRSLLLWVKAQTQAGTNRYQAVISFLKFYDLDSVGMIDRYYQFVKRSNTIPYRVLRNEKSQTEKYPGEA